MSATVTLGPNPSVHNGHLMPFQLLSLLSSLCFPVSSVQLRFTTFCSFRPLCVPCLNSTGNEWGGFLYCPPSGHAHAPPPPVSYIYFCMYCNEFVFYCSVVISSCSSSISHSSSHCHVPNWDPDESRRGLFALGLPVMATVRLQQTEDAFMHH